MKDNVIAVLMLLIGIVGLTNIILFLATRELPQPILPIKVVEEECISMSDPSLIALAKIISSERVPRSFRDMLAIGTVVLNRVESEEYPSSIMGVISQRKQFHGYQSRLYKKVPDSASIQAAELVLSGYRSFGNDVVYYLNQNTATNARFIAYVNTLDFVIQHRQVGTNYSHSYFRKR
jgi:hypothetical protein